MFSRVRVNPIESETCQSLTRADGARDETPMHDNVSRDLVHTADMDRLQDEYGESGAAEGQVAPSHRAAESSLVGRRDAKVVFAAVCVCASGWLLLPAPVPSSPTLNLYTSPVEVSTWLAAHRGPLPGLNANGVCLETVQRGDADDSSSSTQSVGGRLLLRDDLQDGATSTARRRSPKDSEEFERSPKEDETSMARRHLQRSDAGVGGIGSDSDREGIPAEHRAMAEHVHMAEGIRRNQVEPEGIPAEHVHMAASDAEWARATATAHSLVCNMTLEEKKSLVRGVGWHGYSLDEGYYVGSIPAIPRLGIPSITMQDGPQGFRTANPRIVGTVTSWPCLVRERRPHCFRFLADRLPPPPRAQPPGACSAAWCLKTACSRPLHVLLPPMAASCFRAARARRDVGHQPVLLLRRGARPRVPRQGSECHPRPRRQPR